MTTADGTRMMAHGFVGSTMITVHGTGSPTKAEWNLYIKEEEELLKRKKISGVLVFTLGGAPDSNQRKQYTELLAKYKADLPCAVVSDATIVRNVVTAISWINPHIKVFPPKDLRHALGFAGVTDFREAAARMIGLAHELGITIPVLDGIAA